MADVDNTGKRAACIRAEDAAVRVYSVDRNMQATQNECFQRERDLFHRVHEKCTCLAFQPSSPSNIAAAGSAGAVLWRHNMLSNATTQPPRLNRLEGRSEWSNTTITKKAVHAIEWSRCGSLLALALADALLGGVLVIDASNIKRYSILRCQTAPVISLLWTESTLFAHEWHRHGSVLREWEKPAYATSIAPMKCSNGFSSFAQLPSPSDILIATSGNVYKLEGESGYCVPVQIPYGTNARAIATSRNRFAQCSRLVIAHDRGISILALSYSSNGLHTAALPGGEVEIREKSIADGDLSAMHVSPDERFVLLEWSGKNVEPTVLPIQ